MTARHLFCPIRQSKRNIYRVCICGYNRTRLKYTLYFPLTSPTQKPPQKKKNHECDCRDGCCCIIPREISGQHRPLVGRWKHGPFFSEVSILFLFSFFNKTYNIYLYLSTYHSTLVFNSTACLDDICDVRCFTTTQRYRADQIGNIDAATLRELERVHTAFEEVHQLALSTIKSLEVREQYTSSRSTLWNQHPPSENTCMPLFAATHNQPCRSLPFHRKS